MYTCIFILNLCFLIYIYFLLYFRILIEKVRNVVESWGGTKEKQAYTHKYLQECHIYIYVGIPETNQDVSSKHLKKKKSSKGDTPCEIYTKC